MSGARRAVFLDRDGTINVDHGYVHRIADWQFTFRAPEALRLLQSSGFLLIVVSNQSGIGDGRYTSSEVEVLHAHMAELLRVESVFLDAMLFCPHRRDANCDCRKPRTGLARIAESLVGAIDYPASWVVGDKESDVGFGNGIASRTALIHGPYWQLPELRSQPDVFVDSLYAFAVSGNLT